MLPQPVCKDRHRDRFFRSISRQVNGQGFIRADFRQEIRTVFIEQKQNLCQVFGQDRALSCLKNIALESLFNNLSRFRAENQSLSLFFVDRLPRTNCVPLFCSCIRPSVRRVRLSS